MEQNIKIFLEKLKDAKNIAIMGHKNPDGDSFCSVLALAKMIELNYGVRPLCVYDGNIPNYLDAVPLRSWAKYFERVDLEQSCDLVILLDYGTPRHIGGAMPLVEKAKFVVEIDHHKNDEHLAQLCVNDENAAAVGQILYRLAKVAGWQTDSSVNELLAISVITDTGNFRFVRDGDIMRMIGDLVDDGLNMRDVFDLLRNKPKKAIIMESGVVHRSEFYYKNRLAVAVVSRENYKHLDGRGDTVLNLLGSIEEVEFVAMLKEQKPNQTGVSLRSRTKPVNHIAEALGGGGHEKAAGAVINDTLENVKAKVIALFKGE
ncbi:MAG: DHH family phosphoesterase [Alphaproteobacteria bacterium]|nr:DHH family phosphoesterase [Alphaproteobacteria bacterium]